MTDSFGKERLLLSHEVERLTKLSAQETEKLKQLAQENDKLHVQLTEAELHRIPDLIPEDTNMTAEEFRERVDKVEYLAHSLYLHSLVGEAAGDGDATNVSAAERERSRVSGGASPETEGDSERGEEIILSGRRALRLTRGPHK